MAIAELIKVLPPPDTPVQAGPVERWEVIEHELGTRLPSDFRDFGLTYGSGDMPELEIYIRNPFAPGFIAEVQMDLESLREMKPEGIPYDIFPDTPGLMPWGSDSNGAELLWLTDGEPDDWPVVVSPHDTADMAYWLIPLSMTSFLAKAFRRYITTPIWPMSMFENASNFVFEPTTP